MDIIPTVGFVPRPTPAPVYVVYFEKRGDYAELHPATLTWTFTSRDRYATKFASVALAQKALAHIEADCGDLWHLTQADLRIVEKA